MKKYYNTCFIPQEFNDSIEFINCYLYVLKENLLIGLIGIALTISVVFLNLLVIIKLLQISKRQRKINIFDRILIIHCVIDACNGLFNISLKHFVDIFGYWPLGDSLSIFWTIYDQNHHTVSSFHMLYMRWIRFRSIKKAHTFSKELMTRYAIFNMFLFWLSGFVLWTLVVAKFGVVKFSTDINYHESDEIINLLLNISFLFIPYIAIFVLSIKIINLLKIRSNNKQLKRNQRIINKKNKTYFIKINVQSKIIIIISAFLIQWLPCSILGSMTPLLINQSISILVNNIINWFSNISCLIDPILILLLNSNLEWKK